MQIILDGKYKADRSVVALGMFDGVHIGHRVLLERGTTLARRKHVPLLVCTFQEHPLQVIAPDRCPPQLTTFEERWQLMEELGVDVLYAMPFTREIMEMPPEEYVGHLVRRFHPTDVVCGYNHTYGSKGQGTPALLEVLGGALGFATSVVPNITLDGREVSSSATRRLIASGDVAQAAELLGRPYALDLDLTQRHSSGVCCARVIQNGKQLPASGEYRVLVENGGKRYPAAATLKADGAAFRLPASLPLSGTLRMHFLRSTGLFF